MQKAYGSLAFRVLLLQIVQDPDCAMAIFLLNGRTVEVKDKLAAFTNARPLRPNRIDEEYQQS